MRHPYIHDDHVGSQLVRQRDGLDTVGGLPHHLDPRLRGEYRGESGAHHRLVVGDEHRDRHAVPPSVPSGRVARTR
jgi:hypothetical protein